MTRPSHLLSVACILFSAAVANAVPRPGPTPRSWQFVFEHGMPKRIVITPPGADRPQAYWYLTYTVSNPGPKEQSFNPTFEMVMDDGLVIRSDGKRYETVNGQTREVTRKATIDGKVQDVPETIPPIVLEAIRQHERNKSLQSVYQIAGALRAGRDEAKEGVAIWPEPNPRMGKFSLYVTGLSGEIVTMKQVGNDFVELKKDELPGKDDKLTILRRTLQIRYQMEGDERNPGNDRLEQVAEEWVYR